MSVEKVDTLVVGAGQAGIAASEHLTRNGVPHLVLERARIAERWRSERWDSLVANGPAWHDRFPGLTFDGDPDAFVGKEGVADYFVDYAQKFNAPVRTGIEVTSVTCNPKGSGFVVETSQGVIEAARVIAATGPFQKPVIPAVVPETPGLTQMHSTAYRNPQALAPGGVLVGDDYFKKPLIGQGKWPEVRQAFDEFFAANAHTVFESSDGKCYVGKPA